MDHEKHYFDLLPGFALGSLDEGDQRRVAEHLTVCSDCQAELRSYRKIVDHIPLAMRMVDPPPELKPKIMDAARKSKKTGKTREQGSWWGRFTSAMGGGAFVWVWVSLVLILGLGISNLILWGRLNEVERKTQAGLISIAFQGTEASPHAHGMLVVSRDGEYGTLVVDGLPILDESSQYQLWLIRDGQRTNGGIFSVNEEGYGSLWVSSPDPLFSYQAFGITVEPAGGSPGPTGEKVMGAEL